MSGRVAAALPLVAAGLLAACGGDGGSDVAAAGEGGTAVVCLTSQPPGLNPFTSPDLAAADFLPLLYTPLVRYGEAGDIRPWLAESYAWNEDGTSLTMTLRSDVRWHDGQPVTAEDVAFTIRAAADTAYAYWSGEDFFAVSEVRVPAPGTVEVDFAAPPPGGEEIFAALPILPAHLLAEVPPGELARADYNRAPVGSGPFRLAEWRGDGTVVLTRNDDFPEALGRAALDRILVRTIPDVTTQLVELRTGNVDACVMSARAAEQVADAGSLTSLPVGPASVQVLPLRNDLAPLDDARVRRALSAALDRTELAHVVSPLAEPAGTYLPMASPYRSGAVLQPDDAPERAAAMLDSAGWSLPAPDAIRTNAAGEPLVVRIVGPQTYEETLTVVQAQLRRVGVDARVELMEGSAFGGVLQDPARRPPAMALAFTPTRVEAFDPYAELHSEGWSNLSAYSNAGVDSMIEAIHASRDADQRGALYHALQERVAEDVPTIYTVYVPRLLAVGQDLTGVTVDPWGPFARATEWRAR